MSRKTQKWNSGPTPILAASPITGVLLDAQNRKTNCSKEKVGLSRDNQAPERLNRSAVTDLSLNLAQSEQRRSKTKEKEIVAILRLPKGFG